MGRALLPVERLLFVEEFGDGGVESCGDAPEVADSRVVLAALNALDGVAGDPNQVGELLLGEVLVHAPVADVFAEGAAVIEDPGRQVGRHSTNALTCKIISQQLFSGIFRS